MNDIAQSSAPPADNWDWHMQAACRGMDSEMFFHSARDHPGVRRSRGKAAKAICRTCPVVRQCLDYALRTREPYGIWGGRSEYERARMLGVQSLQYPAKIKIWIA